MTPAAPISLDLLRRFAPGSPLREAAELIMAKGTGALILIGDGSRVDSFVAGGFRLTDTPFTAQRLAELAKMDGGIVVDDASNTIVAANVHFMPDPRIETAETGTRFRTAERLARQTGATVLSISEEGNLRAVVFSGETRFTLQSTTDLLAEANQRLQSLERIRNQFDESIARLDRYEAEGIASVSDVVAVIQRAVVIKGITDDLDTIAAELGDSASIISLQAEDLEQDVEDIAELVYADYHHPKPRRGTSVFRRLDALDHDELYSTETLGQAIGFPALGEDTAPRGIRALAEVPRLPVSVRDAILKRFNSYGKLVAASAADLAGVEGVGRARAETIRSYLGRRGGVAAVDE